MLRRNRDGAAFDLFMVVAFLLFAAFVFGIVAMFFNGMAAAASPMIAQGMVSQQTADTWTFIRGIAAGMLGLTMLGTLIWAVVRARERQELGE